MEWQRGNGRGGGGVGGWQRLVAAAVAAGVPPAEGCATWATNAGGMVRGKNSHAPMRAGINSGDQLRQTLEVCQNLMAQQGCHVCTFNAYTQGHL